MKDLTLCLMTCGEETEGRCLEAIKSFRSRVQFFEVRNVCPQIRALNRMIDGVKTEFFIPLDADIILDGGIAYERICEAIHKHRSNPSWHSILFPLWDTLTQKNILALKILRTHVMKKYPFVESATPDVEHFARLTKAGFGCIQDYLKEDVIGCHVVEGNHFCYHKYRDVYNTYRSHGWEWDSGAFMGGDDLKERAKNHFDFFMLQWIKTNRLDYLWCIAGMMDGILCEVEHASKSLDSKHYLFGPYDSVGVFLSWYLEVDLNPEYDPEAIPTFVDGDEPAELLF